MAIQFFSTAGFLLLVWIGAVSALVTSETLAPPVPKAISELRDSIVKGLGFHGAEGFRVSGFDVRDALVGQSVAYEFDIEVEKKVIPFKLLEDVSRWDFVDLPIFRPPASDVGDEEKALAERGRIEEGVAAPVLPPFQIAGPMELWIQDADDIRLALPHDVDAGTLKKVLLSDGAAVIVKGARSVSLWRPLDLPLPLNRSNLPIASGLLNIAETLRSSARSSDQPLVSLRIVGPSSLTSSTSSSPKLKLKRLSPGLVELSSRSSIPAPSPQDIPNPPRNLWPLTLLNGSDANLRGFEELLSSVLGKKGLEKGTFRLLKAEVSAQTYMKMSFFVEKKIADGDVDWSRFPSWKTKPEKVAAQFQVLARVEGGGRKVVPERIQEIQPIPTEDSVLDSVQTGNKSMTQVPLIFPPPTVFTL